jgi:hypothetical protein
LPVTIVGIDAHSQEDNPPKNKDHPVVLRGVAHHVYFIVEDRKLLVAIKLFLSNFQSTLSVLLLRKVLLFEIFEILAQLASTFEINVRGVIILFELRLVFTLLAWFLV